MLDISRIIQYPLNSGQYRAEDCSALKKIIVIHHTAGGANPFQVVDVWNSDPAPVGTAFVIGGKFFPNSVHKWQDGDILQCFPSNCWDYHLGLSTANNTMIAKSTVGIEICNYGSVINVQGKYYAYTGHEIPAEEVVTYPIAFRVHAKSVFFDKYGCSLKPAFSYHRYTNAQIESLRELLLYLADTKFKIDKTYNSDMWNISKRALAGEKGIWSHVSYRLDKADCHPQPNLVSMLKSLSSQSDQPISEAAPAQ